MKRILVVDCNAKMGGIQKALLSFLEQACRQNEVYLLLFFPSGCLLPCLPPQVKLLSTRSAFRYMGMSRADCALWRDRLRRGFFVLISRTLGQRAAVSLALFTVRDALPGPFDEVISFSHLADRRSFFGGAPAYALHVKNAGRRVCFLHCDYLHSGNRSRCSDRVYAGFDEIACVSRSVREAFVTALPRLGDRAVVRPIEEDADEIRALARQDSFRYDERTVNALVVARMTKEKGMERIVRIFEEIGPARPWRLYLLGDGIERERIAGRVRSAGLSDRVILLGEQMNPYRFMRYADLLIVPSYHEACPLVYQEAIALGLPVLTTRTLSAEEMIGKRHGMVVDNTDEALRQGIEAVLREPRTLIRRFQAEKKEEIPCRSGSGSGAF